MAGRSNATLRPTKHLKKPRKLRYNAAMQCALEKTEALEKLVKTVTLRAGSLANAEADSSRHSLSVKRRHSVTSTRSAPLGARPAPRNETRAPRQDVSCSLRDALGNPSAWVLLHSHWYPFLLFQRKLAKRTMTPQSTLSLVDGVGCDIRKV